MAGSGWGTALGICRWDLGVKDGRIAFVRLGDRSGEASRVIDAAGKIEDR
jgi:N-acyl-D-aspartate/D-glutamate deacylase